MKLLIYSLCVVKDTHLMWKYSGHGSSGLCWTAIGYFFTLDPGRPENYCLPPQSLPPLVIPRMEDLKVRITAGFHLLKFPQGPSVPVLRTGAGPSGCHPPLVLAVAVARLGLPPLHPLLSPSENTFSALLLYLPRGQDFLWVPNPFPSPTPALPAPISLPAWRPS